MAHYCSHQVRHRGGLYDVPLRYGLYGGGGRIKQVKGKPLRRIPRDNRKIIARAERQHCRSCYDY